MYTLWYYGYLHRAVEWEVSDSVSKGNTATIFQGGTELYPGDDGCSTNMLVFSYQKDTRYRNIGNHNMNGKYDLKVTG
jgi:hypothetical protein